MNRRNALAALGAASLMGLAGKAAANEHEHHQHSAAKTSATKSPYLALQNSASDCVAKGEVCLAKCLEVLATGDSEMAECAMGVNQMLAVCESLQKLAAQSAALVPAAATLGREACEQCAKTCKPHNAHHAECQSCYDACLECIEQCEAVATS